MVESYQLVDDADRRQLDVQRWRQLHVHPGSDDDHGVAGIETWPHIRHTATDNDTGVSEPKTITITVTGSNDAPVVKTRLKKNDRRKHGTERQRASGHDVDVRQKATSWLMMRTEGSLMPNDDAPLHVHSRQRLRWLASHQDRDVTLLAYTATDNGYRRERAEDHHHYRDAATTRQWQKTRPKRPKKHGTERQSCQRPRMWTVRGRKPPVGWWCDRRQLDVQRWRQLHVHSRQRLPMTCQGQETWPSHTPRDWQRHRRERAGRPSPLPGRAATTRQWQKTRLKRPKKKHGTERHRASGHGCGRQW